MTTTSVIIWLVLNTTLTFINLYYVLLERKKLNFFGLLANIALFWMLIFEK